MTEYFLVCDQYKHNVSKHSKRIFCNYQNIAKGYFANQQNAHSWIQMDIYQKDRSVA